MHQNYFQAIVQLRNPSDEAADFLRKSLGKQLSWVDKVRNGLDFYVKDKKTAEVKARKLRDRFGGEFNIAASLHTRDTKKNKDLYRLNILVRLPDFGVGDVLKMDKDLFMVCGLGKKVEVKNLRTWKKKSIKYPEDYETLEVKKSQVVKIHPHLEVLDPETYQPIALKNKPKEDLVVDEKVKVVFDKGYYLL